MGVNGTLIAGIFRLSKNGFLGSGGFGFTYKATFEGTMPYNGKEVAIKFTPIEEKKHAFKEYEIYTYLWAIDNPIAESFGIPTVYYFGSRSDYVLMAITLLEPTFHQKSRKFELTLGDVLITFREFVCTTKSYCRNPWK